MLNNHEQREIRALEQQLRGDDPEWVLKFDVTWNSADRQRRFELTFFSIAMTLSMLMFGVMLAAQALAPALFFAAATALLVWHIRRLRHRAEQPPEPRPPEHG